MEYLPEIKKNIIKELADTLFHILSTSWIIFGVLELIYTGFTSNYFNVHWFLMGAIGTGMMKVLWNPR